MKVSIEGAYVRLKLDGNVYGHEELLPQEIERLILELRRAANMIYAARNKPRPFYRP